MGEWVDSHNFVSLRLAPDCQFSSRILRGPRAPPPPQGLSVPAAPLFVGEGIVRGEVNSSNVPDVNTGAAVRVNGSSLKLDSHLPPASSGGGVLTGEVNPPMVSEVVKKVLVRDHGPSLHLDSPTPPASSGGGVVTGEVKTSQVRKRSKEIRAS